MSNQEAIALLRNLEDSLDSYCELSEEGKTAFRMAIEALSSSEFPNSSDTDTISRADAIKIVQNRCKRLTTGCVLAVAEIRNLPPIQPKRGRWHYSDGKPARIGLSFGVICDQCGTESEYCTNFCGECGADMRQKGENSESN